MYKIEVSGQTLNDVRKNVAGLYRELHGEEVSVEVESTELEDIIVSTTALESVANVVRNVETVTAPAVEVAGNIVGLDSVELDENGLPWDARIHSSNKKKMKNKNVWMKKKGVKAPYVVGIEHELRLKMQKAANPVATPSAPTTTVTPVIETVATPVAAVESIQTAPSEAVAPVVAASTPSPVAMPTVSNGHTVQSFTSGFPVILSGLITEGKVEQAYIQQLCDYFKVNAIFDITDEQKAQLFNSLVEHKLIQKAS